MLSIMTLPNSLNKTGENRYFFRSVVDQTIGNEQLIKEIIAYNSTITEADARAVLSVLNDRVRHLVNLGYRVELPFGYAFLRAKGTVKHLYDGFVPGTNDHRITANFKFKDDAISDMIQNATYRHDSVGYVSIPVLKAVNSILDDGTESDVLSFASGSMMRLKGEYLSFDVSDANQGIFMVNAANDDIRMSRYNRIGSNIIESYVPTNIAVGDYELKIVTKPGLKRYEKGIFTTKISVTA